MMFFLMRQYLLILLFIFFPLSIFAVKVDYRLSAGAGMIMPDGKVDVIVDDKNAWVGPVYNADFSATFYPAWQAMQDWRGAGVGVGLSYWNFGHSMLGHALAPYVYMDIPFVQLPHFRLGIRPAIGVGFLTKTYANTVPEDQKYLSLEHSNRSVGSVTNCYFPEMLYLDFPITNGWSVGIIFLLRRWQSAINPIRRSLCTPLALKKKFLITPNVGPSRLQPQLLGDRSIIAISRHFLFPLCTLRHIGTRTLFSV